ncbi:GNAT family N-acetyltransferase [Saccharospirillum mangrovi]|uniref:GNAT family N-acetyltransferase n=1 Tax=Saccharospirillum mangrovi TaxID=2161747 RepID=UPI0018E58EC9|nr:GNAT family N-acetyltransferase [Saccharospirillum mangrovi]
MNASTNLDPVNDIQLRPAVMADKPALLALEQALVKAERPFNSWFIDGQIFYYDLDHFIQHDQTQLLVAEAGGEIIATGYLQIRTSKPSLRHDREGYLGFMYVTDAYRGKGVNKMIMHELMDWAKAQGVRDFYLDVYAQNQTAIRAYEKLGFEASLVNMKLSSG